MTDVTENDDLTTADAETVRRSVAAWLENHWDPSLSLVQWRRALMESGWAVPAWPRNWHGRGLASWATEVVADELRAAQAVGTPLGAGMALAAPTILEWGPDSVRQRFLAPILTGEETWCQLFSEPGAGSDLAGLTTSAQLDGDEWVVNGQKVWNTSAHHADFGILLARTDWDAPKHRGLTFFLLPMHQPGVEVRPLRQMNGYSSFNEVFFSDARLPRAFVIGEINEGWRVALTTLSYERRFSTLRRPLYPNADSGVYHEAEQEAAGHFETYHWYPQRAGRIDLLVELARQAGVASDPIIRQELARVLTLRRVSQWTAERAVAARALGRTPGAEGSIGKLASSMTAREAARVHALIAGARGTLTGDATGEGLVAEILTSYPAQSIAGGTDEIQKNILAERILGLPRDLSSDRDLPFRAVPRNG